MSKKNLQTKKVFSRSEVEEYVKKMLTSAEVTMCEQKDRIVELKQEKEKVIRENEELQAKIKQLQRGISETERANKQITKDVNIQTKLVVEKVQQFAFKWKAYFEELFDEVEALKSNASVELFAGDVSELVSAVIEATSPREKLDSLSVPIDAEIALSENEWMERKLKKLSEEPKYTLSSDSESKYKNVMSRLKSTMIYSAQADSSSSNVKFDINEALNPKDSLDKIINDINE